MYPNTPYAGEPPTGNEGAEEQESEVRRCIVDEDLVCPPSRYDCTRPCPYVGWERRLAGRPG